MVPIVELKDLSVRYSKFADWILNNFNLKIYQGEIIVLTGRSGCGKSTLLKLINGILPGLVPAEIEGDIKYSGRSVREMDTGQRAQKSGTVFQNPELQLLNNYVIEELPENFTDEQNYIERLGLKHLLNRRTAELSGGEKQKAAIISVLLQETPVMLFDEPSSNLDETSSAEFYSILKEIKNQKNTAIVLVEHWIKNAAGIADRIYNIDGKEEIIEISATDAFGIPEMPAPDTEPGSTPLLTAENLSAKVNGTALFKNVNLNIYPGEIVGMTGPNGSGKSTLAEIISGLKKSRTGSIKFNGKKTNAGSGNIGLVLQNPYHQVFGYSVREEVEFGAKNFNKYTPEKSDTVILNFNLSDLVNKPVYLISHGELERTILASAFMTEQALLILDEPFQGLGVEGTKKVIDLISRDLNKKRSILLITHNRSLMKSCCSRILKLENGKLYEE
ncbi:ABC transporter ATP-binding protein [candidate division KSB1 bacterium]